MFPICPGLDRSPGMNESWWSGFVSLLFPERCPFCRKPNGEPAPSVQGLCPDCSRDIQWIRPPWCPCCGRPFVPEGVSHLCLECLGKKRPFKWARAVARYQGGLAKAIARFKYQGDIRLISVLGKFWEEWREEDLSSIDAVIPVPLHPNRLRERGFNQALLLCRAMKSLPREKIHPGGLERTRNTPPQVRLDASERRKNVHGAFSVSDPSLIRRRRVLIVDDVYTTGATVNECARVLKRAGAAEVFVLTLARVESP